MDLAYTNNNFIEFLLSFKKFLNAKGFNVTDSDIEDFIRCIKSYNLEIEDKYTLADVSASIFCKKEEDFLQYKRLFISFYDRDLEINVDSNSQKDFNDLQSKKQKNLLKQKELEKMSESKGSSETIKFKTSKELKNSADSKTKELLKKLEKEGLTKQEAKEVENSLKGILVNSVKNGNFSKVNKEITELKEVLKNIIEAKRQLSEKTIEKNIDKLKEEENSIRKRIEEELSRLQSDTIYKQNSSFHRENFSSRGNSIISAYNGKVNLDMDFVFLTNQEKNNIKNFIRSQAIKFRTRATRSIRTKILSNIDFKTTMKKATETGGIPLRIAYEKPKLNKSKIVMFLDISGSCKEVSELMLYFMYTVKEVFQGGVKCYVFVDSLVDVSDFLKDYLPEESVKIIFKTVPTMGVYSNYYVPFKTFVDDHISEITKDTLVYFIGDARNNRNESGEENVKRITSKAKKSFWLNTEERDSWNVNDSIIGLYSKYVDDTFEVINTRQLIETLETVL